MTTEQKFNCIFCKDIFDSKEELQVHFRKHGDPKFKSKNYNNSLISKENVKGQPEMVSCDVCSQMFPTISKAITHKHKVHPDHDVKYFCPWCGKLFTMKHPYNIHLQTNHEKEEQIEDKIFHCDCCDVDFFLPSAMIYHNKFFHRQDTDIPDIGSSKKLKLYYNQEIIQIHYCAFCGEEYENKVNLYKHVTDDHSDENQSPEEVLRCPLCEAIFYHLDAYEIHLSFHTTEDLYSGENELMGAIVDFSLETVPPMIEKVEREDLQTEQQSQDLDEEAVNTVGIENFLELAMGQADDSNPGKVKKKKHKRSKKSAITLNEFLSMNQDVFGEGLDFQGVEEVPTRVVAKQFKNNKKSVNAVTTAELEKLKSKGIVVMKVGASKQKLNSKKVMNKTTANKELKTSNELLAKLMNQSNKQIKVVKKSVSNELPQDTKDIAKEKFSSNEVSHNQRLNDNNTEINSNSEKEVVDNVGSTSTKLNIPKPFKSADNTCSPIFEECSSTTNLEAESTIEVHKNDTNMNDDTDMIITSTNTSNTNNEYEGNSEINIPNICDSVDNVESSNLDDNKEGRRQEGQGQFDSEIVNKNKIAITNNIEVSDKYTVCKNSRDKNSPQLNINPLVNSLSTLKHLSHLTVKPVIQNKNISPELTHDKHLDLKLVESRAEHDEVPSSINSSTQDVINSAMSKSFIDSDPTLDALKVLSKNITIKSLTSTEKSNGSSGSDEEFETDTVTEKPINVIKLKDVSGNKNITIKKIKVDKLEPAPINKAANSLVTPIKISQVSNTSEIKSNNTNVDSLQNSANKSNTDILKHLPNIITKSLTAKKNVEPHIFKETNVSNKPIKTEHKEQEVIEISDIDESDDEKDNHFKQSETKQDVGPLKTLSKHITVKSLNLSPNTMQKDINPEDINDGDKHERLSFCDNIPSYVKACSQKLSSTNLALKNALKNLGKNITVKSRNSSPSQSVKSHEHASQDSYNDANDDDGCDSDMDIGKVKITEIDDQNSGHGENFNSNDGSDNGPIIETPHDSCSEEDEKDDKEYDFESEIKVSMVHKNNQELGNDKNAMCLSNLSKSITIKSINSKSIENQEQTKTSSQLLESVEVKNQSKLTPTKSPNHQYIKEPQNENISCNKNNKNITKSVNRSSNESSNQKVSVNKEVTVKTFQTKTVIEEITTTVTKTIKTVNQTVKQETRDSNQINIPVLPQKVIGMKPSTSKSLQGVVIRHAAPVNIRPSNAGQQIRPSNNVAKPTKQIVPMRFAKPSTPRMPSTKPNLPKSSPNKQVIGKPLKFSATALMSAPGKRPNAEVVTGPFSCFKKPKESLIPVSDIPSFSGEGVLQVNASSHTSTSNYMSTSKTVKGNSVVTAMQTKSEVTTTQQLSKVNTTGIKIKNAQAKQTQMQEKGESSAMKQTTLDAIEKLQKQGLLIKKPRMEENENSDSEHTDDNIDYSSTDEQ